MNIFPTAVVILVVLWHIQNLHALIRGNTSRHENSDFYFQDTLGSSQNSTSSVPSPRMAPSPSPGRKVEPDKGNNNPEKSERVENVGEKLQNSPSIESIDLTGMLKLLQQLASLLNPLNAIKAGPVKNGKGYPIADHRDDTAKLSDSSSLKSKNPTAVFSGTTSNADEDSSEENGDSSMDPNCTDHKGKDSDESIQKSYKPKPLPLNRNKNNPSKINNNPTDNQIKPRNGTSALKSGDQKVNIASGSASGIRGDVVKEKDTTIKHSSGNFSNNDENTDGGKKSSLPNPRSIVGRKIGNDSSNVTLKSNSKNQGTTGHNSHNVSHSGKSTAKKDKLNVVESKPKHMKLFKGPIPKNEFVDEYINKRPRNVPKKGGGAISPVIRNNSIPLSKSSISVKKNKTLNITKSHVPRERKISAVIHRHNEKELPSKDSNKTQRQIPPQNTKGTTGKLKSPDRQVPPKRKFNDKRVLTVRRGKTDDKINTSKAFPSQKHDYARIRPSTKDSNLYKKSHHDNSKATTNVQKFKGKALSDNTSSLLPHKYTSNNNSKDFNNVPFQKEMRLPRVQNFANETKFNNSSFPVNSHSNSYNGNPEPTKNIKHLNHTKTSTAQDKLNKKRNSTNFHSGNAKFSKRQSYKTRNKNSSYPEAIKSPSTRHNRVAVTKRPLKVLAGSQSKRFRSDSGGLESQNLDDDSENSESDESGNDSQSENLDNDSKNSESDESSVNDSQSEELDDNSKNLESDESGDDSKSQNLDDNDSESSESDESSYIDSRSEELDNYSQNLESDESSGNDSKEVANNATAESPKKSTLIQTNNSSELPTNFKNKSNYTEPLKVARTFDNILDYIYRHSRNPMFKDIKKQNITIR